MAPIHILSTMLRCRVVKHLRRRFEPPREETRRHQQKIDSGSTKGNNKRAPARPSVSNTYRLQDCHRHLKFCPAFLLCSGGAAGVCCAGRWGLWLPAGAGWDTGGGDGVTVGCGRVSEVKYKTNGDTVKWLKELHCSNSFTYENKKNFRTES